MVLFCLLFYAQCDKIFMNSNEGKIDMKRLLIALSCVLVLGMFTGCAQTNEPQTTPDEPQVSVTENANGVVAAAQWQEEYPEIYASFVANEENSIVFDHVEEYPMISVVYEGMAFNKYYNAARSHSYSLEDVQATGRPHALANCLTCKSADYTAIVNAMDCQLILRTSLQL